jgi:hypothetical protein
MRVYVQIYTESSTSLTPRPTSLGWAPPASDGAPKDSRPRSLRAPSDVDLLVIGEVPFGDVVSALAAAQSSLGREINPVVYSAKEFRSKLRARHHFLTTVMRVLSNSS